MFDSKWVPFFRGESSIVAKGFFPSEHSARWWHRLHAHEAVQAGALIRLRGQWYADPERLGSVMEEIGRREARECIAD